MSSLYSSVENNEGLSKIDAIKQSFQEKADSANAKKEKAKEKAPDGKLNIAATRDSRIIKNYDGVDGFTAKEGQMKDLAARHDEGSWKSPAFDIVPTSSYKTGKVSYGAVQGSGQGASSAGRSAGASTGHSTGAATTAATGVATGASTGHHTGATTGYSTGAPTATHTNYATGEAPRVDAHSTPAVSHGDYAQGASSTQGYTQAAPNTTQSSNYAPGITTGYYNQGTTATAPSADYSQSGDASRSNTDQVAKPSWINSAEARNA